MSKVSDYKERPKGTDNSVLTATIDSGQTVSDAINVYGCTLACVETPSAMTGDALTFEGSIDGGSTFVKIKDKGGVAYTVVVSTSEAGSCPLDSFMFYPYDRVKVVSDATEGADRVLKLKAMPL